MLGDSINSSPSKSNKSIHKVRWLRKNKRKKLDKSVQNHDNEKQHSLDKVLRDFYEDSEQSEDTDNEIKNNTFIIKKPSAIVKHFKPFELEKCLAMADRISANQDIPNKRASFPEIQGFSTCQNLAGKDITTFKNQELSFMITESELINCCHQAEKVLSSQNKKELPNAKIQGSALCNELDLENPILQTLSQSSLNKEPSSPQLELELVNSILQDFSQSPITKEQSVTPWQYTPEFRLRIKPKKTYSRKCLNQTRINLSNRLESITSEEEDNSYCSSLSIQEDMALLEGVSNPVSVTNTSQRLCENLINLSAFFTQNSPTKQNSSNNSHDQIAQNSSEALATTVHKERLILSSNIPDLLHEILTLRSKCPKFRSNSCDSNEDFYGFPSPKSENHNEIDLLLEDQNTLDETVLEPQNIKLLKEQNMDINSDVSDSESSTINVNPQFGTNVNKEKCTDWNEDDYQDVFACIDTDKILLQHNICKNHPTYLTSSTNIETAINYVVPYPEKIENDATLFAYDSEKQKQDTSSKPVGISGEDQVMAAKVLSRLTDIPVKSTANNCDNLLMSKDENIFKNPEEDEVEDDEWNDDCDFFKNFQTPVAINESSLSNLEHNEKILKESFSYSNDFPSTSKMAMRANIGFQTAAGKCVAISNKAQESVQKLLKEFSTDLPANFDLDELMDMKTKIYTKKHNLHYNSKVIKDTQLQCSEVKCNNENLDKCLRNYTNNFSNVILNDNIGFKTAKGKNIKISSKAQKSVEKLLNEFKTVSEHDFGSDLAEVKQEINKKNSKIKVDFTLKENNHKDIIIESRNSNEILNTNMGFQTAKGKEVTISTKARESVERLLKEFKTNNDNLENHLLLLKQELNKKNSNKKPKTFQEITNEEKATELEQPRASKSFTLTNKEQVEKHFSENNEDLANMILSEWPLSNHFNNSISSNKNNEINPIVKTSGKEEILYTNGKSQDEFQEQSGHTQQQYQDDFPKNENHYESLRICDMKISKYTNIGFQTAKGNEISISAKAQLAVDKLLQEFRSDLNENSYEKDLMVLKSNIEQKNKELKEVNKNSKPCSTQEEKECASIVLGEWPLSPNKNSTPKELTAKRKLSIDNSDIPSPMDTRSPHSELINKELYTTKSLFTERKIRTPLNSSPVKSIIARKNLLSLTKRRKNKRNLASISNEDDSGNHNEKKIPKVDLEFKATPIKSSISIINSKQTPNTPILKDFFSNAPQTSTPRVEKITKSPQTPMDIDFKPIAWDRNNDVTVNKSSSAINETTKLSDSSCSNISFNSSNPSAKERIARLKMYGKAPAVSPILIDTHNSCRPSGLRRTRSMLKKKDNN